MTKKEKNIIMQNFFAVQELNKMTKDDPEQNEKYFWEYTRMSVLIYELGIDDLEYSDAEKRNLISQYYEGIE